MSQARQRASSRKPQSTLVENSATRNASERLPPKGECPACLAATRILGGWLMFCSNCHRQIFYRNLENRGYCETCKRIVEISPCRVSYWCVAAVVLMPWLIPLGIGS